MNNQKYQIQDLPSINASFSDFTGVFPLKTNQKLLVFIEWIFTCLDFHGKIKTKVCRNCERYYLKSCHLWSAFKITSSGGSRGGARGACLLPSLSFRPNWGPRGRKKFFLQPAPPHPFSMGLYYRPSPPPPPSPHLKGLDPALTTVF